MELISDDEIERIAMQMTAAWMVECWKDGRTPSQEGQVEFFGDFWDAASMAANIRARWRAERQSSSPRSIHYDARMAALDVVAYYAAALVGVPGVVPPKGTESMSQTEIRARLLNALLEVPEMPKE